MKVEEKVALCAIKHAELSHIRLEACMIVCPLGAVTWEYPPGGFGIRYRYG